MPAAQNLREVNMVNTIDSDRLLSWIKKSVQYPKTCKDLA